MYFPYFRGKQNELILLRENVQLISQTNFTPIIEPVKTNTNGLVKTLDALLDNDVQFILVINPLHGDFKNSPHELQSESIQEKITNNTVNLILGIIIDENTILEEIETLLNNTSDSNIAIIHYGFTKAKSLNNLLVAYDNIKHHIFIDHKTSHLYRRQFRRSPSRVLIQDGFIRRSNKDYPSEEHYSDLHLLFDETYNMTGFGDFSIVGDDYNETGGPAYAVAIHITDLEIEDIDEELDDEVEDEHNMVIRHYISDSNSTFVDPGGKFIEALTKLVQDIEDNQLFFTSQACEQYKDLFAKEHFPGLGIIKKLSMQHHLELMNHYLTDIREE